MKFTHDAKALWRWARGAGLDIHRVEDTQLMSFLFDPTGVIPHRLDQLTKAYLHHSLMAAKKVLGVGKKQKRFSEVAPEDIAPLAGTWAKAIAELAPIMLEKVQSAGQRQQYDALELPLASVLADMERTGVLVDQADLARLGEEFQAQLAELEAEIHALAGRSFNIGSTKQLSQVLFEDLELPVIKRTKTGYSTDSEVLERLASKHEIAAKLLAHRKVAKLINTYTDVLQAAVDPQTGRVHATFQQTVGATGRLISTDPDLQRTPIRTPEGKRIRRAFVAPAGARLVSADWSQIELRILAHVSEDPVLIAAFEQGLDVHRRTASELFEISADDVSTEQRAIGKTVNFATIYGQGATALAKILGIERKKAETYIARYFEVYAGVRRWLDQTIEAAMANGYATTLHGRRRLIPELHAKNMMDQQTG
ncbi:MAG: DNA polymerase, partial [Myxococcota bacterium]